MKLSWTIPLVAGVVLAEAGAARADQCAFVDRATAAAAVKILTASPSAVMYCEPCEERPPTARDVVPIRRVAIERQPRDFYQVVIDRREIDLAYTFVKTGAPDHFENLAKLANCPATGVSSSIEVHAAPPAPAVHAAVAAPPQQPLEAPRTTYVVEESRSVSFLALLGTCTVTSALSTLGLFFALRRRRLAMRPRAIRLVDRSRA